MDAKSPANPVPLDASVFPFAARYLANLPEGEESYPECQVKGSVLRGLLETTPVPFPIADLPQSMRTLIEAPPLPNAWVSEVQFNALMLAHEAACPPDLFREWVYQRNKQLLSSSLYRILFLLVSPERMFAGMSHRWNVFRKGTELVMLQSKPGLAQIEVRFPAHLHDQRTLGNLTIAARAACDAAGGKGTEASLETVEPRRARLLIRWH